jgi:Arc/MetJ-type ribon-helix-helix transcriptional regulator
MRLADRLARRRGTSRSAVFREGVRALAENDRRERDSAARRKRQREAIAGMNRLARKAGDWPAEEILRAWRYRESRDSG